MESKNSNIYVTRPTSSKETIIGIDLGTTNSCASVIRNNVVDIIPQINVQEKIIP